MKKSMFGSMEARAGMKEEEEKLVNAREEVENSRKNLSIGVWGT